MQSSDPRLHEAGLANFTYLRDLTGNILRAQGADSGTIVVLNDVAGRPSMTLSNIRTADSGTEDLSEAVIHTWQYETVSLPGRPLSITEQVIGKAARITERFVYADNTDAEKILNLAGQCVSHYDTAGLVQTDSVALTGMLLSVTRRLLRDADRPDVEADWQDGHDSVWNDLLGNETYITLTTVDATGATLTTTDAKGNMQRVAYDVAGLLSGSWLTLKGGKEQVIVASLTYSAAGQKLREVHGNGVVTTYSYETQTQRLTGIKTERPVGRASGTKVLQDLRYEYDPVGNVLSISNDAEEPRFWNNQKVVPENTYTYDSLYQLVKATGREMANAAQQGSSLPSATVPLPTDSSAYTNYTRTYTYDSAGNLTQVRHSAPATGNNYTTDIMVSNRSNRAVLSTLATNAADVDALFTAGGQQKQLQPGQALLWTPRNELLQVTPVVREGDANDTESYRYDAGSQRVLKVTVQKTGNNTQTQQVMYQPGIELRTTSSGSTATESLWVITVGEAGRAQVRVLHRESGQPTEITGGQVRYSYDNLTGSSQLELDGEGNIISMEEYYPYGGTAVLAARSAVEVDYKTVRYSGKERDATGLYYYGHRYYQPWTGRWLSADPAGTVDGLNLFRMCRNNPVTFEDPDGQQPQLPEGIRVENISPDFIKDNDSYVVKKVGGNSRKRTFEYAFSDSQDSRGKSSIIVDDQSINVHADTGVGEKIPEQGKNLQLLRHMFALEPGTQKYNFIRAIPESCIQSSEYLHDMARSGRVGEFPFEKELGAGFEASNPFFTQFGTLPEVNLSTADFHEYIHENLKPSAVKKILSPAELPGLGEGVLLAGSDKSGAHFHFGTVLGVYSFDGVVEGVFVSDVAEKDRDSGEYSLGGNKKIELSSSNLLLPRIMSAELLYINKIDDFRTAYFPASRFAAARTYTK